MVKSHKNLPAIGLCKLCRERRNLERSHIHPRLAYKRFASDQPGGPFIDLAEFTRHNRQLTRRWFCRSCESLFERFGETPTANWLDRVGSITQPEYEYGPFLHTFTVSLVYRYCLLDLEDGNPPGANREMLRKPMEAWRNVLLGKRRNVGVYTMHCFLVPSDDENGPWEAAVGGQIAYVNGLVLARTGPLVGVGLLGKVGFTSFEARQWSETEVSRLGGLIKVIRKSDNSWAIAPELCHALNSIGRWCFDRTKQFHSQQIVKGD